MKNKLQFEEIEKAIAIVKNHKKEFYSKAGDEVKIKYFIRGYRQAKKDIISELKKLKKEDLPEIPF